MQPAAKLVRQIRDALEADWSSAPLQSLASDYARLCQEANQRLESCAAMLEKGSEYQALQLAETEPVLLDLIATLSFAEAPEWVEYCQIDHLPVPPKFDPKAVQALDRIYARGIGESHPLYKDYRAAMTLRDDAKALHIIRSIVSLNPSDANAASELARIENKLFQLKFQDLRAALPHSDEPTILSLLSELERLAAPSRLEEFPEYSQACEIRRNAARNEAIALASRLLEALEEEREAGSWRMAGELLGRLNFLQTEHGFNLSEAEAARCAELQQYVDSCKADAERAARFNEALLALGTLADTVEARLLARSSLTLSEAQTFYAELGRGFKEIESFPQPLPEEVSGRARAIEADLKTELERLRQRRKFALITASAAALVLLTVSSWIFLEGMRARKFTAQLASLRAAGQVEAVEKMSAQLYKSGAALAKKPYLSAGLHEAATWTRDERAKLLDIERELTNLELTTKTEAAEPAALASQLGAAGRQIDEVATGLRAGPAGRLLALHNQFEARLVILRERLVAESEGELARLETLTGSKLGYDQPKESIAHAIEEIEPVLASLETHLKSEVASLELPASQQARVVALRKRVQLFHDELDILARVHEAIFQAATLDSYLQALAGYKTSRLSECAEVSDARKLLAALPKPDDLLAGLLLPGDPAGWAAAKADETGAAFFPGNVLPEEIGKLVSLRDDNYLNDIWEFTFTDFRRKNERRELYSRGDLKKEGPNEAGNVQTTRWIGSIYDPSFKTETAAFGQTIYTSQRSSFGVNGDGEVSAKHLSGGSECLGRLELDRMTNADGSKFERPLLRVFDELVRDRSASPLFKGCLMQQLGAVLNMRRYPWGLGYCNTLREDLEELNRICDGIPLRTQDWLLERKRAQLGSQLAAFFSRLQTRTYLSEARLKRQIVRAGLKAGLQFGGFIENPRRAHLLGEARNEKSLWALGADGEHLVRFIPSKEANESIKPEPAVFSPVFFVPRTNGALPAEGARDTMPGIKPESP